MLSPSLPLQVKIFRGKVGLPTRPSLVHCEGVALKAFMSLIVRRNDGANKRVLRIIWEVFRMDFRKPKPFHFSFVKTKAGMFLRGRRLTQ